MAFSGHQQYVTVDLSAAAAAADDYVGANN